jgi:hypothetical protein
MEFSNGIFIRKPLFYKAIDHSYLNLVTHRVMPSVGIFVKKALLCPPKSNRLSIKTRPSALSTINNAADSLSKSGTAEAGQKAEDVGCGMRTHVVK